MLTNSIELTGLYFSIHLLFREKHNHPYVNSTDCLHPPMQWWENISALPAILPLASPLSFPTRMISPCVYGFICLFFMMWAVVYYKLAWELQLYHIDQPSVSVLINGNVLNHYCSGQYVAWEAKPSCWITNHLVTWSSQISQYLMLGSGRLWGTDQQWYIIEALLRR